MMSQTTTPPNRTYSSHILAIGPHPDDIEVGCWGILRKTSNQGKKNIIVDLSPSQLSTHGSTDKRLQEAQNAAHILGISTRHNCWLQDGAITDTPEHRAILVDLIRTHTPEIVLMPRTRDRHPDHENAATLIKNSVFFAGLTKYPDSHLAPHKPRLLLHYMIRHDFEPDLIVALNTKAFEAKMHAFQSYASQHATNGRWFDHIRARHTLHGTQIWSPFGEGYKLYSHGLGIEDFDGISSGFF